VQSSFIIAAARARLARGESNLRTQYKVILATLALAMVGCGGGSSAEEPSGEATSGGEAAYAGPITSTDVAHGKEVFDNFCGDCHPDGGEDVGPSLIAKPHTPAKIRQQVREGAGKMRPFSEQRLSKDDLETVLAWLASVNAVK
jgi:mono/diheme cytochrome c family protein